MPNSDSEWWRKCGMWKDNEEESRQMRNVYYPLMANAKFLKLDIKHPIWELKTLPKLLHVSLKKRD